MTSPLRSIFLFAHLLMASVLTFSAPAMANEAPQTHEVELSQSQPQSRKELRQARKQAAFDRKRAKSLAKGMATLAKRTGVATLSPEMERQFRIDAALRLYWRSQILPWTAPIYIILGIPAGIGVVMGVGAFGWGLGLNAMIIAASTYGLLAMSAAVATVVHGLTRPFRAKFLKKQALKELEALGITDVEDALYLSRKAKREARAASK